MSNFPAQFDSMTWERIWNNSIVGLFQEWGAKQTKVVKEAYYKKLRVYRPEIIHEAMLRWYGEDGDLKHLRPHVVALFCHKIQDEQSRPVETKEITTPEYVPVAKRMDILKKLAAVGSKFAIDFLSKRPDSKSRVRDLDEPEIKRCPNCKIRLSDTFDISLTCPKCKTRGCKSCFAVLQGDDYVWACPDCGTVIDTPVSAQIDFNDEARAEKEFSQL